MLVRLPHHGKINTKQFSLTITKPKPWNAQQNS